MNAKKERGKIDWVITLVPLAIVYCRVKVWKYCSR